jgi:hypothetical protein
MADIVPLNTVGLEPPPARPEPRRDHFGRYLIVDPKTGEEVAYTRATTFASSIADTFALTNWKVRMTAVGLARRKDLLAGVAAVSHPDSQAGKKKIDELCEAAKEHAGSSQRANLGTALHAFLETLDGGGKIESIPDPWERDVEAYYNALSHHQVRISANYIERVCVLPQIGVAGTLDRLAEMGSKRYVFDIKTGSDLKHSWTEIAIQLGIYAHADTIYDPSTGRHHKMPEVDQDRAIVAHLPAGEASCKLYLVNIDAGWRSAYLCSMVREWRKRKDLATPIPDPEKEA